MIQMCHGKTYNYIFPQNSLILPLRSFLFYPSICNPWQPLLPSLLPVLIFIIMWSHKYCITCMESCIWNLFESDFSTQENSFDVQASCWMCQSFIPFYCWVLFHSVTVPQFNHSFNRGQLRSFLFRDIVNELAVDIMYNFLQGNCVFISMESMSNNVISGTCSVLGTFLITMTKYWHKQLKRDLFILTHCYGGLSQSWWKGCGRAGSWQHEAGNMWHRLFTSWCTGSRGISRRKGPGKD